MVLSIAVVSFSLVRSITSPPTARRSRAHGGPHMTTDQANVEALQRAMRAAVDVAAQLQIAPAVAIVGPTGDLLAFLAHPETRAVPRRLAQDKAYTAAGFGMRTSALAALVQEDPAMAPLVKADRLLPVGGGVPLFAEGHLIGAVGVSGGTVDQDIAIAEEAAGTLAGRQP